MKKKRLFYAMLLSRLGFAASIIWIGSEFYDLFKYDIKFDFKTVPTLFLFAVMYQIFGAVYDKTK